MKLELGKRYITSSGLVTSQLVFMTFPNGTYFSASLKRKGKHPVEILYDENGTALRCLSRNPYASLAILNIVQSAP